MAKEMTKKMESVLATHRAYYIKELRILMEWWSDYLDGLRDE